MQLRAEVKSLPSDDRQTLLADLEFRIEIPALKGLALKADLCLPWKKMRNLKRYIGKLIIPKLCGKIIV